MKRIKSFGIYQTAKVAGIIYFLLAVVFVIPIVLLTSTLGESPFPLTGLLWVLLPFIYGLVAFVMTAIGCFVYNNIAKWTGGIEVEVETMDFNAE